jgi:hypothetical protein
MVSRRKALILFFSPVLVLTLSTVTVFAQPIRIGKTGIPNGQITELGGAALACERGDLDCTLTVLTTEEFDSLSPEQLRQQYDVLLFGLRNDSALGFEPDEGDTSLWNTHLEPFLNLGGGIVFEASKEAQDLMPGVEAIDLFNDVNTDRCLISVDPVPPAITQGILDEDACTDIVNNPACFFNFHMVFSSWNANLFPFMQATGYRRINESQGGGVIFDDDCFPGFAVGLYGEFPGGGRIVLSGPDSDFHAWPSGPIQGRPLTRLQNQYDLLINEILWVNHSEVCPIDSDLNQDGITTPADALLAFQYFLSFAETQLNACELSRADVTRDGEVTPADALCIFRKFLGLPSCLG